MHARPLAEQALALLDTQTREIFRRYYADRQTVAEIAARSVPSLLIPYPFATADHQTVNAHLLVDAGAADMLGDSMLDAPDFAELLLALVDDASKRALMRDAARSLGAANAAQALADEVEAAARG